MAYLCLFCGADVQQELEGKGAVGMALDDLVLVCCKRCRPRAKDRRWGIVTMNKAKKLFLVDKKGDPK